MSTEWSEYFETITQFLVGASRQYGVANGSFTEYAVDRLDLCISTCSTLEEQMITNSGEGILELAEEAIIVEYKTELECLVDSLISIQLKWKDYQEVLEARLEEFAYQVNSSRSRSRGRPRFQRTTGVPVINWF